MVGMGEENLVKTKEKQEWQIFLAKSVGGTSISANDHGRKMNREKRWDWGFTSIMVASSALIPASMVKRDSDSKKEKMEKE